MSGDVRTTGRDLSGVRLSLPEPTHDVVGVALAVVGALGVAIDWAASGKFLGLTEATAAIGGWGLIIALCGVGLAFYGLGRVGPAQQSSCCGCSCVVLVLAIPVTGLALWAAGGPVLALLAFPAQVPLLRALDAVVVWASS